MQLPLRTLVALWGLASLGGDCGGGVPRVDECADAPPEATVMSLGLGGPDSDTFDPIEDGDVVDPVSGSQGGSMLPVRLRLRGEAVPACIAQRATVTDAVGNVLLEDATPLRTYGDGEGMRTTRPHLLIFDVRPENGDWITVTVEAAGQVVARSVWLREPYDGPTLRALEAPATVRVGDSFDLAVMLDRPLDSGAFPLVVRADDPAIAEVAPRFYLSTFSNLFPVRAVGPGEVEIRAALGRNVQSTRVMVTSQADADAGL